MFNTTVLAPRTEHRHEHVHVTQVDPSVEKGARFLNEVQAEAEKRITKAVLVDVPSIDAWLVTYKAEQSFETFGSQHRMAFKINGKEFNLRVDLDSETGRADAVRQLAEQMTREILGQIQPHVLMGAVK